MRHKYLILISLFFLSCSSQKEIIKDLGEPDTSGREKISNYFLFDYINLLTAEDYYTLLDSVQRGVSDDYLTLRMAYTKTEEYSPYEVAINDSLRKAVSLLDEQNFEEALSILEYIHDYNYVNIPSHLYAGYIYREMGDEMKSEFHYNVYTGLLNSIYESGDGHTPETAFIVITTKEEYSLLTWFGLRPTAQTLMHSDGYSFDLLNAVDPETNEEYEIFFNIELAFDTMRRWFGN